MKLTIKREDLLKPLQLSIGVVERRQTMPILANVLLSVKNQELSVVATDLEVELSSTISIDVASDKNCAVTVSGRKIVDICRTLPANSVIDIEENGKSLTIRSGNSHFNLATLPVDEFPRIQNQQEKASFNIPQKTLLSLVKRTHFAIAENNPHYYLNGLLLEIKDGIVRAAASDGHRMSIYELEGPAEKDLLARVIVPQKAIQELLRLLSDSDDQVTVSITKNYIHIQCENFTLISKLIDSKYPNHNKLIPHGGDKKIILDRDDFKNALVRVGILSNEILRSMRLELLPNLLRMVSNNNEQEKAEESIPIDYSGSNLEIGFNIAYLLDVLNTIKTNEISMTFKDGASGIIIEEVNGEESCLYVVMPFQL